MTVPSKTGYRTQGGRKYELSNHLRNVLAVVTDNIHLDQDSTWVSLGNVTDYYPFGLAVDGRTVQDSAYRYWFNGKERDSNGEWGSKGHYDYGFRIYNPSIAKFLSVDPLTTSYPWYTPYQFAGNKPVIADDLDGLEERIRIYNSTNNGKVITTTYDSKTLIKSVQTSGEFAMHSRISKDDWVGLKKAIWRGFSGNENLFASGYNQYTIGMGGRTDTDFTGLNQGTLTIGAGPEGNILVFDPGDYSTGENLNWGIYGKAIKTFNPVYPISDPNVGGSDKFAGTIRNVQSAVGVALGGPAALSGSGLLGIGAKASVLGGMDDLSGALDFEGRTVIQNTLGEGIGNFVKTGLSVVGAGTSAISIHRNGVNTADIIGGALDTKSLIETNLDRE